MVTASPLALELLRTSCIRPCILLRYKEWEGEGKRSRKREERKEREEKRVGKERNQFSYVFIDVSHVFPAPPSQPSRDLKQAFKPNVIWNFSNYFIEVNRDEHRESVMYCFK